MVLRTNGAVMTQWFGKLSFVISAHSGKDFLQHFCGLLYTQRIVNI